MRRTQIYLDENVDARLRERAAADGRSAAAVIREALDSYLGQPPDGAGDTGAVDPIRALAGGFSGLPVDASVEHDRDLYGERDLSRRSTAS